MSNIPRSGVAVGGDNGGTHAVGIKQCSITAMPANRLICIDSNGYIGCSSTKNACVNLYVCLIHTCMFPQLSHWHTLFNVKMECNVSIAVQNEALTQVNYMCCPESVHKSCSPRVVLPCRSIFDTGHWRSDCSCAAEGGMHCPCTALPSPEQLAVRAEGTLRFPQPTHSL